ncbi:unnamed protein product [Mytilus coruscus]|uniref:Novel STAND NTPase 3 domain-containing protein n=1 Tax=Mytilus coruscus TaxID=42192 RepID=A0A6J8BYD9_MYTCO|nr:unnamed protein product [Mytilus coruscus]
MNLSLSVCHYYTDSRVVLGYICHVCNTTRRFFTYVSNRVEKIHKVSEPSQWSYVSTDRNPADLGTRFISSPNMQIISSWINGPNWLLNKEPFDMVSFPLLSPHDDKEIRPEIVSRKTQIDSLQIDSQRFSKFSSWRSLVRSLSLLRHIAKTLSSATTSLCKGWHICAEKDTPDFIKGTETLIIRQVQKEFFEHEIDSLNTDQHVPQNSAILKLDPILDEHGILRNLVILCWQTNIFLPHALTTLSSSCWKNSSDKVQDICIELTTTIPTIQNNHSYGVQNNISRITDFPPDIALLCFPLVVIIFVLVFGMTYAVFVRTLYVENIPSDELRRDNEADDLVTNNIIADGIPDTIREQIKNTIENWKREDKKYVEIKAYDQVLHILNCNSCVTITGSPGVGKTATLRHTALFFAKKGYNIFPVTVPEDIRNYYKPGKRTIFVIDDLFGKSSANKQYINAWQQFNTLLVEMIKDRNCKIIVACRLQVYRDEKFKTLHLFQTHECNMVSEDLKLTEKEKIEIAKSHIENFNISLTTIPDLDFFPLLCQMCGEQRGMDIAQFFSKPFKVLRKELEYFWMEGSKSKFKLCALALLVLHNNELEERKLTSADVHDQIREICNICKLRPGSTTHEIQDAFSTLKETYVIEENDKYKTKHDLIFHFIVHYFSEKMIGCMIKYSNMDLIHDRFLFYEEKEKKQFGRKDGQDDFVVFIPENYRDSYLQRIVEDWLQGNVWNVFDNENMKSFAFRQNMIQYLKRLEKSKQKQLANKNIPIETKEIYNPLVCCLYYGYADILKWLASAGVDINQCISLNQSEFSPLTVACVRNQTEMIDTLLKLGAFVDKTEINNCSPIYCACNNSAELHVQLLLKNKANIDIEGRYGVTPLILACLRSERETVRLLLMYKADCNKRLCSRHVIDFKKQSDWLNWLKKISSDFVIKYQQLSSRDDQEESLFKFMDGSAPLHMACIKGDEEIVNLLLNRKPEIDIINHDGATPLFIASRFGFSNIVRLLLDGNADAEIRTKGGKTPLSVARKLGYTTVCKMLEGAIYKVHVNQ